MSVFFYHIFLLLFRAGVFLLSPFQLKARKWQRGRRHWAQRMKEAIGGETGIIWVHCASLGEFEQGRPVMEALRAKDPDCKILLTFFSPSGYEVQKNYAGADWVFYLPLDGPRTARLFLEIVEPRLVIFVKYEFWYFYLKKLKYRNVPLILISALFRRDMSFFRWYGGLQRKILSRFDHLFVQNESSLALLREIGLGDISSVAGDTRFDRVIRIAREAESLPLIEAFTGNQATLVAGSTWPEDEEALALSRARLPEQSLKWIIAPHDISETHIRSIQKIFPDALLYSALKNNPDTNARVLIIDNVGLLSRIYRYAKITYVGGGLRTMGVHNVLEAAVYGKPVITGPYFRKYAEAIGLVESGGGLFFQQEDEKHQELTAVLSRLLQDENAYHQAAVSAKTFVEKQSGATGKIMDFLQEKRLFTS